MLRPYQSQAKAEVYQAWAAGHRNVLLVSPTGSGKTVTFSDILMEYQGASCAIAHRQELVSQISIALARCGVRHSIMAPKSTIRTIVALQMMDVGRSYYDPSARCRVAGVDTLVRIDPADPWLTQVGLWVQDECFPAGTLIEGRPIESIRVGDVVTAFDETTGILTPRKVVRLFRNPAPQYMVRMRAGHHMLDSTLNHPFFTRRGWIAAGQLRSNDEVLYVPERSSEESQTDGVLSEDGAAILQHGMLDEVPGATVGRNDGADQSSACVGADEGAQPDAQSRDPRQGFGDASTDRARAEDPRGQRTQSDASRNRSFCNVRRDGLRVATRDQDGVRDGQRDLSAVLQTGPRELGAEAGDRSGRLQSHLSVAASAGREERRVPRWVGVDSVEVYERSDPAAPRSSSDDGHVYNFEVDGLHTYVAGGLVVHNCHHLLAGNKWGKAISMFPNAYGLGVTATPIRADGKGLGDQADGMMHRIVLGPSMRDLINQGYLSPYRIFAPPSDLDLSAVGISAGGDFSPEPLRKAVHKSHIVGDVVEHYMKIAPGKLGITFAVDIESATEIATAYQAAGVAAEVVSSKTPDLLRAQILRRFKAREVMQLANVDLFGEGFDLPAIEVVSMARPTQSFSLFAQQFGRALRIMEGKTHALIIDHVGNVMRHGLPDAPRTWSLDRRERRSKSVTEVLPVRTCVECLSVYERVYDRCPYCGHYEPPAGRSLPSQVDGDLAELSEEALRIMRGEVASVDGAPSFPQNVGPEVIGAIKRRHWERQQAQSALRQAMMVWGGGARTGKESRSQREFFHRFGIDVLSAMALGAREAAELQAKIEATP